MPRRDAAPPSPTSAARPFASREFTHVTANGATRTCTLTFDAPHPDGSDWAVRICATAEDSEFAFERLAYGVDALQAMRLAMTMARARLEATSAFKEGRLYFLDRQLGLGWDPSP